MIKIYAKLTKSTNKYILCISFYFQVQKNISQTFLYFRTKSQFLSLARVNDNIQSNSVFRLCLTQRRNQDQRAGGTQ